LNESVHEPASRVGRHRSLLQISRREHRQHSRADCLHLKAIPHHPRIVRTILMPAFNPPTAGTDASSLPADITPNAMCDVCRSGSTNPTIIGVLFFLPGPYDNRTPTATSTH